MENQKNNFPRLSGYFTNYFGENSALCSEISLKKKYIKKGDIGTIIECPPTVHKVVDPVGPAGSDEILKTGTRCHPAISVKEMAQG